MNSTDRRSFESFCKALQYFPARLVDRPSCPMATDFIPHNREGNAFVNKRRQNLWSIVHVGDHGPLPLGLKRPSKTCSAPFQKIIIHRFQLRYADIPIEPIIEVVEPYPDPNPSHSQARNNANSESDIRWFNTRVAEAARAILGNHRHSWPRSSSWLNFHFT